MYRLSTFVVLPRNHHADRYVCLVIQQSLEICDLYECGPHKYMSLIGSIKFQGMWIFFSHLTWILLAFLDFPYLIKCGFHDAYFFQEPKTVYPEALSCIMGNNTQPLNKLYFFFSSWNSYKYLFFERYTH